MRFATQTAGPASAFVLLVLAMALTGSNVPFGKVIVSEIPVLLFLTIRFAIATLALLVVSRPADRQLLRQQGPALIGDIVVLSLVGSVLFTVFLLAGTQRTTASAAGIITATLPAVAAGLAAIFLRQPLTRAAGLSITLAVIGLAVMQAGATGQGSSPLSMTGNALVGLAVLSEATFVILSGRAARRLSPVGLSLGVSALGLVFSLPLGLWSLWTEPPGPISASTWALAVWYALSASVFCTILWYRGAAQAPSWQAGLATAALPITALAVSVAWLGETLASAQILGALLVIGAILAGALFPGATGFQQAREQTPSESGSTGRGSTARVSTGAGHLDRLPAPGQQNVTGSVPDPPDQETGRR